MTIPSALRLLTVDQVAEALQVSRSWVYEAINAGTLTAHRVGRSLRVREEVLRSYLDSTRVMPATRAPVTMDLDAVRAGVLARRRGAG